MNAGVTQQFFLGFEYICDCLRTERITANEGLRNRSLRFFLGQTTQVVGYGVHSGRIQRAFHYVSLCLCQPVECLVDNLQ